MLIASGLTLVLFGMIVAYSSFGILGFIGAYLGLLFIPLMIWVRRKEQKGPV